jgi:HSP20 family protein
MSLDNLKEQVSSLWNNLSEGWRHLWETASSALTRFVPGTETNLPASADVDDDHFLPTKSWAMLGGEVFEDENRLIVRVEVPGMNKEDIAIEIRNRQLQISGEKRFAHENTQGRWRVMQCAYGSFRRNITLPCEVKEDAASASYTNGVLRIELPKREASAPSGTRIRVD